MNNLKRHSQYSKAFTEQELQTALLLLVEHVQHISFHVLLVNLKLNKSIPKMFKNLNIFMAFSNILCYYPKIIDLLNY